MAEKITYKLRKDAQKEHEPICPTPEDEEVKLAQKVIYNHKPQFNSVSVKERRLK